MEEKDTFGYVEALKILSPAEINVLDFVQKGYTNKEIAKELCISVRTVHAHRNNICKKLGINEQHGLLKWLLSVRNTEK